MPLYVGLDSSTQSLTAIVLDVERDARRLVFESSLSFDEALPRYGTRHGVLPQEDPAVAVSSPLMWAEALDVMLARVAASGLNLARLAAIAGSAQQHGSVYLSARAPAILSALDARRPLVDQLAGVLSRSVAPIWMDSSTSAECAEIEAAVGGGDVLAERTGSRAFERFTGPQIRKFFKREPSAYAATDRVHLVSSFLASLLAGQHAPVEPGDGSGMNLMDLSTKQWWPAALEATAPGLAAKLAPIVPSGTVIGRLSPYWQTRHGLPPAKIIAWSGDNPCSLIGTGLVREGRVAVSLGTSDTIFGLMREPRVDRTGTGHVFGAPTGDYMGITVFKNGSLAREHVRDAFGLTWSEFSRALDATPPGNHGRILLPWYEPEITPEVPTPGVHRFGLNADDGPGHVRAVVEAQQMGLALHSRWMGVDVATIHATGGASANREILQVMADVFGADVYQFDVWNSACLGAALRACHADAAAEGRAIGWDDVVEDLAEPVAASRVRPDPARHMLYGGLMRVYAECEARALIERRAAGR
ncbi:MAG: xylulokinase [Vicinamibacterales bacterium]